MIDRFLNGMSLREKVGQMFQIGFKGPEVTPEIKEMIEDYYIGGVIYFKRNLKTPEQVAVLSDNLQHHTRNEPNSIPLIISTDQEGGIVNRLSGTTHFPGNMCVGATGDCLLAYEMGKAVATELRSVGINMNLAPVLDVNNNPRNPVIGVRSFGEDPRLVADMGCSYIKGMQEKGVINCGKHFPGHGDTSTDSHLDLPVIDHSRERLEKVELYPFKRALENNIESIMTAHIYFPTIEPQLNVPATLSYNVLTGLLREEMKFEGLIITDCMEMDAIAETIGTVEGSIKTIKAGSDMVLISHTLEKQKGAIEAVIDAVQRGEISERRINQSVRRILRLKKETIGLKVTPGTKSRTFNFKKGKDISLQVARKGVTVVKDKKNLVPFNRKKYEGISVIDFEISKTSQVEDKNEYKNLLVDYLKSENIKVDYYPFSKNKLEVSSLPDKNLVLICTHDIIHNSWQKDMLNKILDSNYDSITLAIRNPYDLMVNSSIPTFITTYDYSPANLKAAVEIITGKIKPGGRLPITLN